MKKRHFPRFVAHLATGPGMPGLCLDQSGNRRTGAALAARRICQEVLPCRKTAPFCSRPKRGKDSSTNVLSFPAGEPLDTVNCEAAPLGDVVLAAETVLAEASQQGISIADHVSHLVVHGVLHLLGHDHERDEDAEAMETLETEILASLGVADPYAEAGDAPLAELAR